jgi:hypothetical protein
MSGQGSPHLFIYYQKQYKINEQGDIEDNYRNSHNEFVVSDGKFAARATNRFNLNPNMRLTLIN